MDDRLSAVARRPRGRGQDLSLIRGNFNVAIGINTAILGGAILPVKTISCT